MQNYYFIRVNGETSHNDPSRPEAYVPGEPPTWPERSFNYVDFCLSHDFVRIGWPAVGDLRRVDEVPERTKAYPIAAHVRKYLDEFREIEIGASVLMPDKGRAGVIFIGDVKSPYQYCSELPFECAHRIGVTWDRDGQGTFLEYDAHSLGITMRGGFWLRAFFNLARAQDKELVERIQDERRRRKRS